MSIDDIVVWIQKNKKGCSFKEYDDWKVMLEIIDSIKNGVFRFIYEGNELCGVVCGTRDEERKIVYINDILTTKPKAIAQLTLECFKAYPDYSIQGKVKDGRLRKFMNIEKLYRRLSMKGSEISLEQQFNNCLKIAKEKVDFCKQELAPSSIFATDIPRNGGDYSAPAAEPMSQVLQSYLQYLPGIVQGTSSTQPGVAADQLAATRATQPGYDALNLKELQDFGVPLAKAGQAVTDSNAKAGAQTNLDQLTGTGGAAAKAATDLNRATNPAYYQAQDAASKGASDTIGAINLNGLSPGEANAVERSTNQGNTGTGNLGLINPTNIIKNAMNFGGAFNSKIPLMESAVGAATGAAGSAASNGGVNPVNIALGQPNVSTAGNFGTGTFSPTTAGTQNSSASNAFGLGNSLLGNMTTANDTATSGAYSRANANAIPNYIPNISC